MVQQWHAIDVTQETKEEKGLNSEMERRIKYRREHIDVSGNITTFLFYN